LSVSEHHEDQRVRAIRLQRERKLARARRDKSKARREAAIKSGDAPTVSPREFSELSGLSIATVYRRVYDGTFKHKKLGPSGRKNGRVLIYRDQLG
jgi:hypothetical protein